MPFLPPNQQRQSTEGTLDDCCCNKKVAHTRLLSVGFWSWSRFLAVNLQVTWVINLAVGCHYFPPGLQLPPQPLRGLLPILLLWTEARWVWAVCLRLLTDSVTSAIWTQALLCLSPACYLLGYHIVCIIVMHWYDISLCTQHYLIHRSDARAFVFAGSVVYLPNLCSLVVRPQITLCPRGYGHGLVSEQSLVTGHFCTCFCRPVYQTCKRMWCHAV